MAIVDPRQQLWEVSSGELIGRSSRSATSFHAVKKLTTIHKLQYKKEDRFRVLYKL